MQDHFFESSVDGHLYDTRNDDWSIEPPLRCNYKLTHRKIKSVADFKATLRAGPYAWPGGYQMYMIVSDGAALSFAEAAENVKQIYWSIANQVDDGWRVVGCDINYEDDDLYCAHSGDKIEPAYGDGS